MPNIIQPKLNALLEHCQTLFTLCQYLHQSLQLIPAADAASLIQTIQSFLDNLGSYAISIRRDELLTQILPFRSPSKIPDPDDLLDLLHGLGSLPYDSTPLVPPITFPPAPSLVNPVNPELAAILSSKSWEIPFPPSFPALVQAQAASALEQHRAVQPQFPSIESARELIARICQTPPTQPVSNQPVPPVAPLPPSPSAMLIDPHSTGPSKSVQPSPPSHPYVGSPLPQVPTESQIQPSFRQVVMAPPSRPPCPAQHITGVALPTITSISAPICSTIYTDCYFMRLQYMSRSDWRSQTFIRIRYILDKFPQLSLPGYRMDPRESPYAIQLLQRIHQVFNLNLNPEHADTFTLILYNLGLILIPQNRCRLPDDDLAFQYFGFLIRHNGMTRPHLPITSKIDIGQIPNDLESFLLQMILVFKDPDFLSSAQYPYVFNRQEFVPAFPPSNAPNTYAQLTQKALDAQYSSYEEFPKSFEDCDSSDFEHSFCPDVSIRLYYDRLRTLPQRSIDEDQHPPWPYPFALSIAPPFRTIEGMFENIKRSFDERIPVLLQQQHRPRSEILRRPATIRGRSVPTPSSHSGPDWSAADSFQYQPIDPSKMQTAHGHIFIPSSEAPVPSRVLITTNDKLWADFYNLTVLTVPNQPHSLAVHANLPKPLLKDMACWYALHAPSNTGLPRTVEHTYSYTIGRDTQSDSFAINRPIQRSHDANKFTLPSRGYPVSFRNPPTPPRTDSQPPSNKMQRAESPRHLVARANERRYPTVVTTYHDLPHKQLLAMFALGPPVSFKIYTTQPEQTEGFISFPLPPAITGNMDKSFFVQIRSICSQYDINAILRYLNALQPAIWADPNIHALFPASTKIIDSFGTPPQLDVTSPTMEMWPELYMSYLFGYSAKFTIWIPDEFTDILKFFELPKPSKPAPTTPFHPAGAKLDWRYYLFWRLPTPAPTQPDAVVTIWTDLLSSTVLPFHSLPTVTPQPRVPTPFDPTSIVDAICHDRPSSSNVINVDELMHEPEPPVPVSPPPSVVPPTPVTSSSLITPQQLRDT